MPTKVIAFPALFLCCDFRKIMYARKNAISKIVLRLVKIPYLAEITHLSFFDEEVNLNIL